uniref:SAC3_GANP domain-containing protein n=1 Tax=Caenorhabditis tropicalis TaxID=1561998 RepID=A0A1I7TE74_9PELO
MATCGTMCPSAEMKFRSDNGLIDQMEATSSSRSGPRSKYVADHQKMVKEYSRSAADTHKHNKPELLRPFPVLFRTVDYLLELYSPLRDRQHGVSTREFSSVFSFVSDRLRSVRQDMIMQNMRGNESLELMEKMLPFYIETDGLCKTEPCSSYNPKLHDYQLEECFGRWYEEVSTGTTTPNPLISASFFFRQLHLKPTLFQDLLLFREMLPEQTFSMIKGIISSFQSNNYCRFFALFKSLDPLLQHSLTDSVLMLRQTAMRTISVAFNTKVAKLPSRLMSQWLGFPSNVEFFDVFLRHYSTVPDDQGNVLISSIKLIETPYNDPTFRRY